MSDLITRRPILTGAQRPTRRIVTRLPDERRDDLCRGLEHQRLHDPPTFSWRSCVLPDVHRRGRPGVRPPFAPLLKRCLASLRAARAVDASQRQEPEPLDDEPPNDEPPDDELPKGELDDDDPRELPEDPPGPDFPFELLFASCMRPR
jgi:hypothetical protein